MQRFKLLSFACKNFHFGTCPSGSPFILPTLDMAKAVEGCDPDISCHIPIQMPGFPRDLLQNFISGTHIPRKFEEKMEEDCEVELTLGLSLNGRFGVDPKAKKLVRSSSIPEFLKPLAG